MSDDHDNVCFNFVKLCSVNFLKVLTSSEMISQ